MSFKILAIIQFLAVVIFVALGYFALIDDHIHVSRKTFAIANVTFVGLTFLVAIWVAYKSDLESRPPLS
jgi:hypothetical protein